jgi:enoyl-CoA hydratase/carnithine racemase
MSVQVERRGPIVLVGLDRPEKRNALDETMVEALHDVLDRHAREPAILVIHSTTPGFFAAGADIAELVERDADAALRGINSGVCEHLALSRWPTIAAVDGWALGGGCELALACDLRLAGNGARFGQPELDLGIMAGAGGNWRLAEIVGLAVARRMLYTGTLLDADAAFAAGLVETVHPADELLDAAVRLANEIATRSWRALELTKLALRLHRPSTTVFDAVGQALLFEGEDKRERMTAFLTSRRRRGVGEEEETGS